MPESDVDIIIVPAALSFPDGNHVFLGFRDFELNGEGNLVEVKLILHKDNSVWKKSITRDRIECDGQTYHFSRDSCPPSISSRWSKKLMDAFIANPKLVLGNELYGQVYNTIYNYFDLPSERYYHLICTWVIGTYFSPLFPAYPFLFFFGPKETGKSKILEILEQLCFNAVKVRDLTPAALGDTVEGQRGTILVDQAEKIGDHLVGLLADSYKRAGGKRRVIDTSNGDRTVREFSTYGPKAFAGQNALDPDLLDRCLRIPCVKAKRSTPDFLGEEPEWLETRDKLYRFLLHKHDNVRQAFQAITPTGTRRGELWRPLQAILQALRVDEEILEKARIAFEGGMQETSYRPDDDEIALFAVLLDHAPSSGGTFTMQMPNLEREFKRRVGGTSAQLGAAEDSQQLRKWIGETISKFSLASDSRRRGRTKVREYVFDREQVMDLYERYIGKDEG